MRFFTAVVLVVATIQVGWSEEPRNLPEGFQSIFNGEDLSQWDGNAKYWSVQDGCLTGITDGSLKHNRFITWRGGVGELGRGGG